MDWGDTSFTAVAAAAVILTGILIYFLFSNNGCSARHILVESKAEADCLVRELKSAKGSNVKKLFAELAAEHSICPSGSSSGGLLVFKQDTMDPLFEKACYNTSLLTVSAPFQTAHGWHIVFVEKR
eukprot:TRINITY_DN3099_c1_g1_i1.p1 TRINITY_DN3099_c1_g1~~TRINITY_DN3099_c1_g1_i1.p1  ORF type:complete len:146 (+),score=17.80 TRINITY_DN3099_c1_g1_i1:63-440(+)